MKKYNNQPNVIGKILSRARKKKGLSKTDLCRRLELLGIEFDRNEIYRIENYRMSVKDFELLAFARVLDIDLNLLKKEIDSDNDEIDCERIK